MRVMKGSNVTGLITNEIEITLTSQMVTYYEDKGYKIPRRIDNRGRNTIPKGSKIVVKTNDLSNNSTQGVEIECDGCNKRYTVEYRVYLRQNHNGKTYCRDCSPKFLNSGTNHPNWKSEKTDEERLIQRKYSNYRNFIKSVMIRDNYICKSCGKHSNGKMVVHHLNGYDWYIEGRVDPSNGIVLCENCHNNFHSIYGRGNNTREQFEEWLGYSIPLLENYNGELPTARKVYCIEENKIYNSAKEFCDIHNVHDSRVYNCCNHKTKLYKHKNKTGEITLKNHKINSICGLHLLWNDEYLQMTELDIHNYLVNCRNTHLKRVICTTTNQTFDSITKASEFYKISASGISNCCNYKLKYFGKLSDGTKLQWIYYNDFITLPREEKDKLLNNNIII